MHDENKKLSKTTLEKLIIKFNDERDKSQINCPVSLVNFYVDNPSDYDKSLRIAYLNNKNNVIAYRDFDIDKKEITYDIFNDILCDSTKLLAKSLAVTVNRKLHRDEYYSLMDIRENLYDIGFEIKDIVGIYKQDFYSHEKNQDKFYDYMIDNEQENFKKINSSLHMCKTRNLYSYMKNELRNKYCISELKQAISDEIIHDKLKKIYSFLSDNDLRKITKSISNQELNQYEELHLISLKKGKIIEIDSLFKGQLDKVFIEQKIIMNKLLSNESDGFIVYHNHPSGVPKESKQDIKFSESLNRMSQLYNITYIDHFIIGQGNLTFDVGNQNNITNYKDSLVKVKRLIKKKSDHKDYERL